MLSNNQKTKIVKALEKGYRLLAGDLVTYHSTATASGVDLLTLRYDVQDKKREAAGDAGVTVSVQGVEDHAYQELLFLNTYLDAQGVTLDPIGHFIIRNERWDFADNGAINENLVPLAGLHCIITAKIRKSVEVNKSQSGTITYGDD
jgi:hypothetical protein